MQKLSLKFLLCAGLAFYLVAPAAFSKEVANPTAKTAPRILVLGDSISAEYGLKRGTGWVALLENRMAESYKSPKNTKNTTKIIATQVINTPATSENKAQNEPAFSIINASISGDTSAGGRSRLAPLIDMHHPTHVIIELGANDALRGLPIAMTEDNLNAMTQTALQSGAKVLLLGMQIPPNYGADYTRQFSASFAKVAKANKAGNNVGLVPFMLKGVADSPDYARLFQADRIHPTEAAHPRILANIWPELQKQLK
ncbi:MAG: arylesterase [Burkholderiaceae bacterium]|nr:arylesterase [Burkholderiaceae bacterium]